MSDSLDSADLKIKIKKLKADRQQIEQDQWKLLSEIEEKEAKLSSIKQELNLAAAASDARTANDDTASDDLGPEQAKKLRILSDKLDMQIINQEIRNALPQLEKIAAQWERQSKGMTKDSRRNQKEQQRFPSMLLEPTAVAEDQAGQVLDARANIRLSMKKEADARKAVKSALCSEIGTLRRQLATLQTEQGAFKSAHSRVRWALQEEEHRLTLLRQEHQEVRDSLIGSSTCDIINNECERIDNSSINQGWQFQAFLEIARYYNRVRETDSNRIAPAAGSGFMVEFNWSKEIFIPIFEATGDINKIVERVLSEWIIMPEDNDSKTLFRQQLLQYLAEISSIVNNENSEGKSSRDDASMVNLVTFCLLCDRLVSKYEIYGAPV